MPEIFLTIDDRLLGSEKYLETHEWNWNYREASQGINVDFLGFGDSDPFERFLQSKTGANKFCWKVTEFFLHELDELRRGHQGPKVDMIVHLKKIIRQMSEPFSHLHHLLEYRE